MYSIRTNSSATISARTITNSKINWFDCLASLYFIRFTTNKYQSIWFYCTFICWFCWWAHYHNGIFSFSFLFCLLVYSFNIFLLPPLLCHSLFFYPNFVHVKQFKSTLALHSIRMNDVICCVHTNNDVY